MEYVLRVNGATLVLPEFGSSAEELSTLLTARFGATEAGATRAVALEDSNTKLVFPLSVVAARPDFVAQADKLEVLFSFSPETVLLYTLRKKGLLSEQEVRTLAPLCEDPFVSAAFEVYRAEGDQADLVDTLQRIVAIRLGGGAQQPTPPPASRSSVPSGSKAQDAAQKQSLQPRLAGNELLQQLSAALKLDYFPQEELMEICSELKSKGKISADDVAVLVQLINKELPHLQAAYEIFLEERDEAALLNSLKRVARHFGVERVVRGQSFARQILDAFAAGNPMVCGAWDVFVDEHNEDDFRDTLQRCVERLGGKATTAREEEKGEEEAQPNSGTGVAPPSEEKNALRRFVLWLHTQGRITSEQGQRLMGLVDSGSPEAEKAMKTYLQSQRTEEDGDVLLKTILAILESEFPSKQEDDGTDEGEQQEALMRDLEDMYDDVDEAAQDIVDEEEDENLRESLSLFIDNLADEQQLISTESARKLKVLVDARDARLLAAFDLFSDERDVNDLADTLQRLADKVVLVGHDDEEDEGDEEDIDGDDEALNLESLFDVIAGMGLSLTYLEIIRDAMEIRHPEVEHAIDQFARTQDREAFKRDLVEFCESQL